MPETTAPVTRNFNFNGMVLKDPDPKMTPQKVAEFYSMLHAELTNVKVKGPTKDVTGADVYEFIPQTGKFQ